MGRLSLRLRTALALGLLMPTATSVVDAQAAELVFGDGFGTGDLWEWDTFVGGSSAVGVCPGKHFSPGRSHFVNPSMGDDLVGDPDGATTHDLLGLPREAMPDAGAYEFIQE